MIERARVVLGKICLGGLELVTCRLFICIMNLPALWTSPFCTGQGGHVGWRFSLLVTRWFRSRSYKIRWARLVPGWVSVFGRVNSWYVTSHRGQLSLAIPQWVGAMSASLWGSNRKSGVTLSLSGHASQTIVVYPPTGSTANEREMSTSPTLLWSMVLHYLLCWYKDSPACTRHTRASTARKQKSCSNFCHRVRDERTDMVVGWVHPWVSLGAVTRIYIFFVIIIIKRCKSVIAIYP